MNYKQRRPKPSLTSSLLKAGTAAAALYGTYQLSSWVWNHLYPSDEDKHKHDESSSYHQDHNHHDIPPPLPPSNHNHVPMNVYEHDRRINKCHQEVISAMMNFLPTLKKKMDKSTDCTKETKLLKQLRSRHRENNSIQEEQEEYVLWECIKTQTVTKMMGTAYAHSLLFLVLTTQIHLLGRRMWTVTTNGTDDVNEQQQHQQKAHARVLTKTYSYFFDEGIPCLCQTIRQIMEHRNSENNPFSSPCWDMTHIDGITFHQFLEGIHFIRSSMESPHYRNHDAIPQSQPLQQLLSFVVHPEFAENDSHNISHGSQSTESDQIAHFILCQTWDIAESPIFYNALHECIQFTFDHLKMSYWQHLFPTPSPSPSLTIDDANAHEDEIDKTKRTASSTTKSDPLKLASIPLIQIITQLKKSCQSFHKNLSTTNDNNPFSSTVIHYPNEYLSTMEALTNTSDLGEISFSYS